ncbi:MAG: hypothetical protein QOD77_2070 [Thermoplasmata archaeon]|jgi:hypothetical protein|nr:hypothetical protein [Thermoplasmata archaeon]
MEGVLPVAVGLALWAVAALVLRHGADRSAHRAFAVLYLLSGTKSLAEGLAGVADGLHAQAVLFPDAHAWGLIGLLCGLAMPAVLVRFVRAFPRPMAGRWAWLAWAPLGVSALFALLLFGPVRPSYAAVAQAFGLFAVACTLWATAMLARGRRQTEDPLERRQTGILLLGMLPSFALTWTLVGLALVAPDTATERVLVAYVSPALELLACLAVAYALLKYRLLGFELKVKGGVKYAAMTFVAGAVLFLLSTYVSNYVLQDRLFAFAGKDGTAVLTGLAGMLLFKPVEKLAARVTDKLFPDAAVGPEAYARRRAREVYHAQVAHVLRDAAVTDREWAFLHRLRAELGLAEDEAKGIEQEVERLLKVDDPRTGTPGAA